VIVGWDVEALALGFGVSIAAIAVAMVLSNIALKKRMTRT
jgi:hypothetical protein